MLSLLSSSRWAEYVQDKSCLLTASKKCHKQSSTLATHQSHGKTWRAANPKMKQWSASCAKLLTCNQMLAGNWHDWYQGPQHEHNMSKCSGSILWNFSSSFYLFLFFVLMEGMLLALMPVRAAVCRDNWHCKLPYASAHAAARQLHHEGCVQITHRQTGYS